MTAEMRMVEIDDLATKGYSNSPTAVYAYNGSWEHLFTDCKISDNYVAWNGHTEQRMPLKSEDVCPAIVKAFSKDYTHVWQFSTFWADRYYPEGKYTVYTFGLYKVDEMFKTEKLGGAFGHTTREGVNLWNGWSSRSAIWNTVFDTKLYEVSIKTSSYGGVRAAAYMELEDIKEDLKRFSKYGFVETLDGPRLERTVL